MHELGITQGIIDRAREAAEAHGARRVSELHVTVTAAADFTTDSIAMYFEMLSGDDDLFRGATLRFAHAPVAARCRACACEFEAKSRDDACPGCASFDVALDPEAPMVRLTDIRVEEEEGEGSGA